MGYFDRKEEMKKAAIRHTKQMQDEYENEIAKCINLSKVYTDFHTRVQVNNTPEIEIADKDSVSAILNEPALNVAVLNFASYKNPGGMFLEGSSAQEESLCHESFLYNVLSSLELANYYKYNNDHKNKALYTDRAIYTPNVIFKRNGIIKKCGVITCAAPNYTAYTKYISITSEAENNKHLQSRIDSVIAIAEDNDIDTLILGAFGCGGAMCC